MYAAKTSKDDATGTEEDPFATIERARDTLTGRTSERRPGVVRIREGVYQTSRTIEVTTWWSTTRSTTSRSWPRTRRPATCTAPATRSATTTSTTRRTWRFGRAWVKEGNRTFTLDGIGPAAS
ncbi:hypothetical protein [Nonomuraea fuscirosea]|uniref:hypothetical protein n=1 Tax=Nonomuraea fuscirosea TaxID=1291556 RepID=UPI0033CB0E09